MNHTSDIESDKDDDGKDIQRVARSRAAKNGVPAKKGITTQKASERSRRALITIGKAKGFLTYDEINQHMPDSQSSGQMDDWLSVFSSCLLYTSPSPRDRQKSRMPSS